MLNRRHIRTLVIQSVYSNSIESIDSKSLKTYISKSSSTSLDLLYCMIDLIKEINIHFNNLESKKFSCPFISKNPYFFFFNKLNPKSFKRNNIINWDLNLNYVIDLQENLILLNKNILIQIVKIILVFLLMHIQILLLSQIFYMIFLRIKI